MAIHYVGEITHQKCWTKNGIRRSPMIGASYDADQPLKDAVTKRTIYRPHKDGTVIWDTDIVSADKSCPYGDPSVDSLIRRENMYNDMFKLIKKKTDRFRAVFVAALPNGFTQKQAKTCARNLAMALSKRYNRPCDYSIHYKKGNLHIHVSMPEWSWEKGNWGSKPKNLYINRHTNEYIYDGVYYDSNGNDIRLPMVEKNSEPEYGLDINGKIVCINQLRGERNKRRWVRQKAGFLVNPSELRWLNDEVDRHINAEFEKANSNDRVVRYPKEVTQKLKEIGLAQKHIGPQSFNSRDARFYEITEHNETVKNAENILLKSYNQQKKYSAMKSSFENLKAEIESEKDELAESEKIINDIEATGLNEKVADMVENIIQPEKTFISDAVSQYQSFFREKQKILNPLIQSLEDNISVANNKVLEKSKRLKTTPKAKARLKMWNGNVKILNDFASALKSYSAKSFIQQIQKIAKRRWQKLSPWSQVKYVETKKGIHQAFLYAAHLDLDMDDDSYDDLKTPKALTVPNLDSIQERANQNKNSIGTFDNENFQPKISLELLSEIVSAESALTETSFDDNMRVFTNIDVNAPQKTYLAEIDAIEEQEYIAEEKRRREEEKRLAEQKAEQERIAREKARLEAEEREKRRKAEAERKAKEEALRKAEEQRRLEKLKKQEELRKQQQLAEQQRIAEEKRLAEDKAKQEERQRIAAEKAKQETEATATRRVADSQAQTQATVVPVLTEAELQEKRQKYDELAKLRDSTKELALQQLAAKICDYAHMEKVRKDIDTENNKHGFEDDYVLLKYPTEQQEIENLIAFYRKHTINFTKDCKARKIATYNDYKKYADEAQAIRQLIDNTLQAGKEQSKRKKSSSTSKTNTHTKTPKRHIVKVDIDTDRTKE